ncbi:hypothetical protein POM88_009072 [Heracleum sosnowskyi]|uniref:Cytochrome P450 n=1 Tax=Heracleum sosnowskyi TaxID=360622 RepID=A0AAD8J984_9APIA|nr:hypothetical protein POM88_009072 [Heracleum sosnowskyi]
MEDISPFMLAISVVAVTSVATITVKLVNWLWLRPKKYEKFLQDQGFHANPYRLLRGDMLEYAAMAKENGSKQTKLSDNVSFHALPYTHSIMIKKYGKKAFIWFRPTPSIQVMDPEQIREIMSKPGVFHKLHLNPADMILGGLISSEDAKWSRDRKIIF